MNQSRFSWVLTAACLLLFPLSMRAVDVEDTRMLSDPDISRGRIAFAYDGDLWTAGVDGSDVRRLTTVPGDEDNPRFSPDGSLVAFTGNYDGNRDVYVVPAQGGVPRRLTWHPGTDVALGFTPDGSQVLFRSARQVFTNRHTQLFTVPVQGGFPQRLQIPHANKAAYSPDGSRLAYTPISERFRQWKHYRGGTTSRIWLYTFSDHAVVQIPQPEGRCNDTDPMWPQPDTVYFISDRNGEFNLFSYGVKSRQVRQLTRHEDFPILSASAGGGKIIYEQAGRLHEFDLKSGKGKPLKVGVASELRETRPRYVSGNRYIRASGLSPSGMRAVFEYRGEIITLPAEKGDPRNLTETPGAHERSPVWSPDGSRIAYFSDQSGEYQLHVRSQDGRGEAKAYKLEGAGFYQHPAFSPDSKKLAYMDNSLTLYWLDLESGQAKKIGANAMYGPGNSQDIDFNWSPDSRWIAYTLNNHAMMRTAHVYSLEEDRSWPLTDGLSDVTLPIFDAGGKYLYFLGSTDAGPVRQWFAMSNADMESTQSIYLTVLRSDLPNPLARESDEEKPSGEEAPEKPSPAAAEAKPDEGSGAAAEQEATKEKEEKEEGVRIDFEGIGHRILALPLPARSYSRLEAGKEGELYFLEAPAGGGGPFGGAPNAELKRFSLESRKAETLASKINGYALSADKKKMLLVSQGGNWSIVAAGPVKPGTGRLDIGSLQVRIDPRQEWEQIFHEAWRINRDYFYATNYHGTDWEAQQDKYSQFLPHLATRRDLNRVIQWMCSELAVGHHGVGGGDSLEQPKQVGGGLLGADYSVENGRYRFSKVYGGLNWNPDLRSPLTEPGVDVHAGEYLLAVEGRDLTPPDNLYSRFENTAGKNVEVTVGPNPDGSGSRTVTVVPIPNEGALRNRDWVEGNLRKVEEATDGRVAYVYVPNTAQRGHTYFKRYFYPQSDREAVIIDERFNGGGQVADYYIDILRRPLVSYWAMRYGDDLKTPSHSIQGPKVMIIDETAGSGGDLLPWMFRKFKLGTLVGRRTWGGLVGILGFPTLMDGGGVTAPNLAIWTEEGGWVVENVGVPPDIEVEQWPADVIAGRDPQLEKAIEVAMEELEKHPPSKPHRPPFPVRNPPGN